ncbi:unnamed protein product [Linum trigynum]|uniref:Plant thionin family protein n=1 Tax=Linum trigynum TaxID=586398 RepID=A0AAV2D6A2_9ROSI
MKMMLGMVILFVIVCSTNPVIYADYLQCFEDCLGHCELPAQVLCNIQCEKKCHGHGSNKQEKQKFQATNSNSHI